MPECPEYPQNIGDIYRVFGYAAMPYRYGVAYQGPDLARPGYYCWHIEMDDGDSYTWRVGVSKEDLVADMLADDLEVARRNPLPKEQEELAFQKIAELEGQARTMRSLADARGAR